MLDWDRFSRNDPIGEVSDFLVKTQSKYPHRFIFCQLILDRKHKLYYIIGVPTWNFPDHRRNQMTLHLYVFIMKRYMDIEYVFQTCTNSFDVFKNPCFNINTVFSTMLNSESTVWY